MNICFDVVLLSSRSSPSAILLEVSKFPVNPVYGHSVRSFTHIFKEVFKRLSPTLTHVNPDCPIPFVLSGTDSMTPANHTHVRGICSTVRCVGGVPMLWFSSPGPTNLRAKFCKPFSNSVTLCKELCTAVLANSTFRFLSHMSKVACEKLIIADKASFCTKPTKYQVSV